MIGRLMFLLRFVLWVALLSMPLWLEGEFGFSAYGLVVQMPLGIALLLLWLLLWFGLMLGSSRGLIRRGMGFFAGRRRQKAERHSLQMVEQLLKDLSSERFDAATRQASRLASKADHPALQAMAMAAQAFAAAGAGRPHEARQLLMKMQHPDADSLSRYIGARGAVWLSFSARSAGRDWYQLRREGEYLLSVNPHDAEGHAAVIMADIALGEHEHAVKNTLHALKKEYIPASQGGRFYAAAMLRKAEQLAKVDDLDAVITACEEGLKYSPYHPALVSTKLDALMANRDYAKASKYLQQCWKNLPYRPWFDRLNKELDEKSSRQLHVKLDDMVPENQWINRATDAASAWVCGHCHADHELAKPICPQCDYAGTVVPSGCGMPPLS